MNLLQILLSFSFLDTNNTSPLSKYKEYIGLHTIDLIDYVVHFTLSPLLMFTMVLSIEGLTFQVGYNTFLIVPVIAELVLVLKEKAKGGKIGITGGCPITVTLIRHIFLFRDGIPGETSPVTWGFEKEKVEVSIKDVLSHKSH
jgi:hypothetical protein